MIIPFFIVEQNMLNNHWMVYSKCDQLVQCYHWPSKKVAEEEAQNLNVLATQQAQEAIKTLPLTSSLRIG